MSTHVDARQIVSRDTLTQTANNASGVELDNLIRSTDSELTMPLRLRPASPTSLVLNIDNITVTNPEHLRNRSIPPISNLIPSFTSGTVTFPSSGSGNATPSTGVTLALGMTANQFMKVGIHLDPTGAIVLTKGTAASSSAAATAPAVPSSTYAIGYFLVQTNGSNLVANVDNPAITQYVGGGSGSGGTGNASSVLETLKNEFVDSPYELLTPVIISSDAATKFSSLSGAAYDLVTSTIKFSANSQVATSVQLLDSAEFLSRALDVGSIDLSVFWNLGTSLQAFSVPSAFTYEVSRDGGTNWFTIPMSRIGTTNVFRGPLRFDTSTTTEASKQTIFTQATADANRVLNASTQQSMSQAFTLAATTKLQEVVLNMAKAGTPAGNFYVALVRDNAGVPSLLATDVLCQSNAVAVSSVISGPANVTIDIPDVTLTAGTYHIVISTDAAYKASFVSTTSELRLREKQTSPSAPFTNAYNGTAWSAATTNGNLTVTVNGRLLDLRVRITSAGSPTYPCGLDGFGIFYNLQDVGVVGGVRKTQKFIFNSVVDNTSTFTINSFTPDIDLMQCFYVERGQVFKAPAFSLSGNVVTFPTNTFYNNGVPETVTLIFDQNNGGTYDNADSNARLLAFNHLGSTNASDDKSLAGRGIYLRDQGGTLKEVAIGAIPGRVDGNAIPSGMIGETIVSSVGNSTNRVLATNYNMGTIALSPGKWRIEICGTVSFFENHANALNAGVYIGTLGIGTTTSNYDVLIAYGTFPTWGNATNSYLGTVYATDILTVTSPVTYNINARADGYGTTNLNWVRFGDGYLRAIATRIG